MKKLLLSCAAVALASSAFAAGSVKDILGTYQAEYEIQTNNVLYPTVVEGVTITQVDGNEVEISPNMVQWDGNDIFTEPIPATYNPTDGTLTIYGEDFVSNWTVNIEFANSPVDDLVLWLDEDGTFYFDDGDNDFDLWLNSPYYAIWEYYLFPVEVGVGGEEPGEEPGDQPGVEGGTEMVIDVDSTEHFRFLSGDFIANDPSAFFAKIETLDNPLVTIECENVGSGDLPFLNDIAESDLGWYTLYGGNGGMNIPQYNIYVPEGYVITKITATLYSVDGRDDVNWYFDDEKYTSSSAGTEVEYTCNSPIVYITTDDAGVTPTEYADFVITVAEEGSTAVKGLESVDANAPVEFFDLQGRKVVNPSNGIFIRRQGNQTSKVVVK